MQRDFFGTKIGLMHERLASPRRAQRPPTAMYWKRGWQLFFAPDFFLANVRQLFHRIGVMFALNRFI